MGFMLGDLQGIQSGNHGTDAKCVFPNATNCSYPDFGFFAERGFYHSAY